MKSNSICLYLFLGLFSAGAATATAATVFTDQASFMSSLAAGSYTESFASSDPPTYLLGGFAYTGSVSGGTIYDSGNFIGNFNAANSFILTFTSGNVTAVGGNFYLTDVNDTFLPSALTITLSDGTVDTFTPSSINGFRGYIASAPITTLTMGVTASGVFNTLDNLTVGAVPEPTTAGLLAGALVFGLRRRRE